MSRSRDSCRLATAAGKPRNGPLPRENLNLRSLVPPPMPRAGVGSGRFVKGSTSMGRKSIVCACLSAGVLAGTILGGSLLKGQVKEPAAIPAEMTSYRDVVKKVLPAVVSIERRFKPVVRTKSSGHGLETTP